MNATTSSINATPIIAVLYISLFIFVYYFNCFNCFNSNSFSAIVYSLSIESTTL